MINYRPPYENELWHYGILGMKWGVRRYQNADGTLTAAGKKRYSTNIRQMHASDFGAENFKEQLIKTPTVANTPGALSSYMKQKISYSSFDRLKSPDQTLRDGSGDCHSQVMLEIDQLKKLGVSPKALFFIEYDPKTNQGGQTHSFVYYNKNGKTYWFENAWGGHEGIHQYNSVANMKRDVIQAHLSEQSSNRKKYSELEFGDFNPDEHVPGETLQELVDKCLK